MNKTILVCLFWLLPLLSHGDVVLMKNGDRLSGDVESLLRDELHIEIEYAGTISVKVGELATITTEAIYEVRTSETQLEGRLFADSGAQYVLMGDRRIPISIEEIEQLVKKRKAMIRVAGDWRSRADLSLSLIHI